MPDPDGYGGRDKGLTDLVGIPVPSAPIGIDGFVVGVQSRRVAASLVMTSFEDRGDRFAFANHWRRIFVTSLVASVLSKQDGPGRPSVGKRQRVKVMENPGVVTEGKPLMDERAHGHPPSADCSLQGVRG